MSSIITTKLEGHGDNYDGRTASHKSIAIVDDMPEIQDVYALILRARGHKVLLTANSGEQIVSEARSYKLRNVDIVIMDYLMGPMNGLQAAAEVFLYCPQIEVVS
jgi:CheY-like chemotaxis protein